jgi:hypothetical protein
VVLGRIHESLNQRGPAAGLTGQPESAEALVPDPEVAQAEADRFLAQIAGLSSPQPWDLAVAACLRRRKILLSQNGPCRPDSRVLLGPYGWTHGDFQHLNVIWQNGRVAAVIDWDRIGVRSLGEELVRSATLLFAHDSGELDLTRVAAFVCGYRTIVPLGAADLADSVERMWWKRLCSFWHLVFHYDRGNRSCDHLFLPESRLLSWWTGHRPQVQAAFAAWP